MSWCDRLASVPTVGFGLTPDFAVHDAIDGLSPILNRLVDRYNNPQFQMNEQGAAISITTNDGFLYTLDHYRVSVGFVHRMKVVPVSGGNPRMEMLSKPLPFTELLSEVSNRLIEAARLLPRIAERKIFNVGIVSATRVAQADVPPGVGNFLDFLTRPWGNLESFSVETTSEIEKNKTWADRCQHKIIRPEDTSELMTLQFDYQRRFESGQTSSESQMRTLLNKCREDALAYFEKLAVGDMFDEHIVSRETAGV